MYTKTKFLLEIFIAILRTVFHYLYFKIHRSHLEHWKHCDWTDWFCKNRNIIQAEEKITKSSRIYFCNGSLWYFSRCIFRSISKIFFLGKPRYYPWYCIEMERSAGWRPFHHWLHKLLPLRQSCMQLVTEKSSPWWSFRFKHKNWGERRYTPLNPSLQFALIQVYFHVWFFLSLEAYNALPVAKVDKEQCKHRYWNVTKLKKMDADADKGVFKRVAQNIIGVVVGVSLRLKNQSDQNLIKYLIRRWICWLLIDKHFSDHSNIIFMDCESEYYPCV